MKKFAFIAGLCLVFTTACGGSSPISAANAVMRLPLGGSDMTVLYLDLTNNGKTDDSIVSVKVPGTESVEADETYIDDHNVVKMRPIEGAVVLPAGQTVNFKPLQKHFMVMGVTQKFKEGDHATAIITFAHAPALTVPVDVKMMP